MLFGLKKKPPIIEWGRKARDIIMSLIVLKMKIGMTMFVLTYRIVLKKNE